LKSRSLFLCLLVGLVSLQCNSSNNNSGKSSNLPLPNFPGNDQLQFEAQVEGSYVRGLRIEQDLPTAIGAHAEIEINFTGLGMSNIGQFEFKIEPDPPTAFDLSASSFSPSLPFVTFPPGVEVQENNQLWVVGANLQGNTNGDAELGTLTLHTSPTFNGATLRLVLFSIGPSSTQRDNYTDDQLNMGVVLDGN
jgi:hypothetical protein